MTFGSRLVETFSRSGHLCVGIDPHAYLLGEWGLDDSASGAREFGLRVVDAAAGLVGIVKPQVAFFERHGSAGYAALEDVLAAARAAGLLVIADAKRGDVGTSVEAYGEAWLTPGSGLEADAVTMVAFQGLGSLASSMRLAADVGKGIFVLAATSNPESWDLQRALIVAGEHAGSSVAGSIVAGVSASNTGSLGSFGVVLGATVVLADYGVSDADLVSTPILAPGFGHQGPSFERVKAVYGRASANAVVSSSRAILGAGADGVARAIESEARLLAEVYSE